LLGRGTNQLAYNSSATRLPAKVCPVRGNEGPDSAGSVSPRYPLQHPPHPPTPHRTRLPSPPEGYLLSATTRSFITHHGSRAWYQPYPAEPNRAAPCGSCGGAGGSPKFHLHPTREPLPSNEPTEAADGRKGRVRAAQLPAAPNRPVTGRYRNTSRLAYRRQGENLNPSSRTLCRDPRAPSSTNAHTGLCHRNRAPRRQRTTLQVTTARQTVVAITESAGSL